MTILTVKCIRSTNVRLIYIYIRLYDRSTRPGVRKVSLERTTFSTRNGRISLFLIPRPFSSLPCCLLKSFIISPLSSTFVLEGYLFVQCRSFVSRRFHRDPTDSSCHRSGPLVNEWSPSFSDVPLSKTPFTLVEDLTYSGSLTKGEGLQSLQIFWRERCRCYPWNNDYKVDLWSLLGRVGPSQRDGRKVSEGVVLYPPLSRSVLRIGPRTRLGVVTRVVEIAFRYSSHPPWRL